VDAKQLLKAPPPTWMVSLLTYRRRWHLPTSRYGSSRSLSNAGGGSRGNLPCPSVL